MNPQDQTFRDFIDNGSRPDTQTTYADGSRRDPGFSAETEESRRPLKPSSCPIEPKGGKTE